MKTNCKQCRAVIDVNAIGEISNHENPIDPPAEFRIPGKPKFCVKSGEQFDLDWDGRSMINCPLCNDSNVFLTSQGRLYPHRNELSKLCDFSGHFLTDNPDELKPHRPVYQPEGRW